MLRSQLGLEAGLVGALSWLVAFPIGVLSIGIALRAIRAQTGLMPPVVVPVAASLAALPIAMLSAGLALWLPSRRLLGVQGNRGHTPGVVEKPPGFALRRAEHGQ